MDHKKIEQAVKLFLEGIGENPEREGLKDTPHRISVMCDQLFGGYSQEASEPLSRTFHAETGDSVCEHHFLPFYGKVHIAYIPDGEVVGLSKLARVVEVFARRAQIQEQLTGQIAQAVWEELKPKGVMVMIEAEHMCMTMRGVQKPGTKTVTYKVLGRFETDESLRAMFMGMLRA